MAQGQGLRRAAGEGDPPCPPWGLGSHRPFATSPPSFQPWGGGGHWVHSRASFLFPSLRSGLGDDGGKLPMGGVRGPAEGSSPSGCPCVACFLSLRGEAPGWEGEHWGLALSHSLGC